MKNVNFKESNFVFTAPDIKTEMEIDGEKIDCQNLHVFKDSQGQHISCWKGGLIERLKFLFTGKIWLNVFGQTHPPVYLTHKYLFVKIEKGE